MIIRDATSDDLAAMATIYDHAIIHTDAIWLDEPLGAARFAEAIDRHRLAGDPIIVAEDDGQVVGYASYGPFRSLRGYATTIEHSLFVADSHQGRGIGQALLDELTARARSHDLAVMVAAIDAGNSGSIRFHERNGFRVVGQMPGVGRKHGRPVDLVLMQRTLHPADTQDDLHDPPP